MNFRNSSKVLDYPRYKNKSQKPAMSSFFKSPDIKLSNKGLTAVGSFGYRSILATHGLKSGKFYFEVEIESQKGAIRIGFSTIDSEIDGPVGIDNLGYSYGSKNGYTFHNSRRKSYGPSYGYKDIIGAFLYLNDQSTILDIESSSVEMKFSYIKFSKNGKDLGIAYENLPQNFLYPSASLYGFGSITFNFGPYFAFPIPEIDDIFSV